MLQINFCLGCIFYFSLHNHNVGVGTKIPRLRLRRHHGSAQNTRLAGRNEDGSTLFKKLPVMVPMKMLGMSARLLKNIH